MLTQLRHRLVAVTFALACTVPWIGLVVTSDGYRTVHPGEDVAAIIVFVAGFAIVGTTFLLAWAAEMTENDNPVYRQRFQLTAVIHIPVEHVTDILRHHDHLTTLFNNSWIAVTMVNPEQDNATFHYHDGLEWESSLPLPEAQ